MRGNIKHAEIILALLQQQALYVARRAPIEAAYLAGLREAGGDLDLRAAFFRAYTAACDRLYREYLASLPSPFAEDVWRLERRRSAALLSSPRQERG